MTEIQFILDLVLNHPLPDDVKKKCLERIGQVEATLHTKPPQQHAPAYSPPPNMIYQGPNNIPPMPPQLPEIVTQTGHGTSIRGPNKMRGRL